MTNVSEKHVKHTNAVNQDESIFKMFDQGIDDEIIAKTWGLTLGYIKGSYKTKWRKARGTARKSPVRGIIRDVVKKKVETIKIEHNDFNLDKIAKLKGNAKILHLVGKVESEVQKYPIISIEPKQVLIWMRGKTENSLFDAVPISAEKFKQEGYYISKQNK